jgi:hypothetical protein
LPERIAVIGSGGAGMTHRARTFGRALDLWDLWA